jgi:hypothetical protein
MEILWGLLAENGEIDGNCFLEVRWSRFDLKDG